MNRNIAAATGALLVAASVLFAGVTSASADTRSVSVSIGDWNCRQDGQYKGSVSKVLIDVVPSSSAPGSWTNGRTRNGIDVIYNPSGSSVTVAAVIFCKTNIFGAGYYRELSFGKWVDRNTSSTWQF